MANMARVDSFAILKICCHRCDANEDEFYLVQWKAPTGTPEQDLPFSWHHISELTGKSSTLVLLQQYLDLFRKSIPQILFHGQEQSKSDGRITYNCQLLEARGKISAVLDPDADFDTRSFPTLAQLRHSWTCRTTQADGAIRKAYLKKLAKYEQTCLSDARRSLSKIQGPYTPTISLTNEIDGSSPPLEFTWLNDYKICDGVIPPDLDTQLGCGDLQISSKSCLREKDGNVVCDIAEACQCLEYAETDSSNLSKPFPYMGSTGLLSLSYLRSHDPIYECNDKCHCGSKCNTRVAQKGRQVPVDIFKTSDGRGWGLRCMADLKKGQFLDFYFGEVLTNNEATSRENAAEGHSKDSYLFTLDKFQHELGEDVEMYVVDGQFWGGPSRFINHSCDPNCRQYVVSFNKNDHRLYNLGFYSIKDIAAGQELTYDYLNKDEVDEEEKECQELKTELEITCRCGSSNCRKWLWI